MVKVAEGKMMIKQIEKKRIFWDLDETLLDTSDAACKFHGIKNPYLNPENLGHREINELVNMTHDEFWLVLDQEFWRTIPFLPWAEQCVKLSIEKYGKENVFFLTSPIPNGICSAGKQLWLNDHFPDMSKNLIITHSKSIVVDNDGILVDDYPKHGVKFEKAGKKDSFFLMPAVTNKLHYYIKDVEYPSAAIIALFQITGIL